MSFPGGATCFRGWVTHTPPLGIRVYKIEERISPGMGFTSRRSHITRGCAFLRLANKPREYVFAKYESTHHSGYFPSWRTHIIRDLSFPGKETHITSCVFKVGEHKSQEIRVSKAGIHISRGIPVYQIANHISLGIRLFQVGEKHITRNLCFPGGETHITKEYLFLRWRKTYHMGYVLPRKGNTYF